MAELISPRLFDVTAGSVIVDGVDVRELDADLPVEVLDDLELKIMDLARARFVA